VSARYELRKAGVWDRVLGRLILKVDPEWADYVAYYRAGGEVDPLPPPAAIELSPEELAARAEIAARTAMRAAMRNDATINFLRANTPAECEAWVMTNVTDLASAKLVLGKLAMIVAYLARERLATKE
jgi:hypothetical protein